MGLRNTVQRAAVAAFKAVGDIARPATYRSLTGVIIRDVDAGTSTPQTVDYLLKRTVFSRLRENERDNSADVSVDEKFMFPALDLPIQAKSSDIILDEHGFTWEITRLLSDPASAVVIVQVRTTR